MNIHELRYGNHILCGSLAEYIPKQICRVGGITRDLVSTQVDATHPDFGEYTQTEVAGIDIEPDTLLSNGWQQSKLNPNRYIYADTKNAMRFEYDTLTRIAKASADEYCERTGVKYLHQLENAIIDCGSSYTFAL